jgi:hypothetical protein
MGVDDGRAGLIFLRRLWLSLEMTRVRKVGWRLKVPVVPQRTDGEASAKPDQSNHASRKDFQVFPRLSVPQTDTGG